MASVKVKTISGKRYRYASRSIRLPNGRVATVEKILSDGVSVHSKEVKDYLLNKEKEILTRYAISNFASSKVFSNEQLEKIEGMRVDYREIIRKLTKAQLQDLFDRFTVNFTYESNALEGNSLTLKDVAIILEENITPPGKDLREVYETLNSRPVVDRILKRKFGVREKDIIRMHSILVKDMGIQEGYKQVPNFIGGRNIITTPPERVEKEMGELVGWICENPSRMHPLQLASHAHGRFERIHPFDDGNGRVGRFLINVILVDGGYPPIIVRKTQRMSYLNALADFDNGHALTLERFMLERYKETFRKFFEVYAKYL